MNERIGKMNKTRVAILINTVTIGGRLDTLIPMIRILNTMGITPDVCALRWNVTREEILNHYGTDIAFRAITAHIPFRGFYDIKIGLLNLWFRLLKEKEYDCLINSNNTFLWLPKKFPVFSYVHFPRKARVWADTRSIHLPDEKLKWNEKSYRIFLRWLFRFDAWKPNNTVVANSQFSREQLLRFSTKEFPCEVIYPGNLHTFISDNDLHSKQPFALSVGRFDAQKRQIEQIKTAELLPEMPFKIVGAVRGRENQRIYESCRRSMQKMDCRNVELYPNVSQREKGMLLKQAGFFLHTTINEPFGLATIEAMAQGCIPVVHDSGGSRELVPWEHLRFRTKEEAAAILRRLLDQDVFSLRQEIVKWSRQFSVSEYSRRLEGILANLIK